MKPPLVITIDGPAGTGKSTVAHLLAKRLGLEFLDTGAMYRAAALVAIESGVAPTAGADLARRIRETTMRFDWARSPPALLVAGKDVTLRLRDADVNEIVSLVAACPEVRRVLVDQQREIGRAHARLVSEGRDQGSVVFPAAQVRFYLDAAPEIRARRRADQLLSQGRTTDPDEVLLSIRERDRIDTTREVGPLREPPGAVRIDTGTLSQSEVVDRLEAEVRARVPGDALSGCDAREGCRR